MKTVFNPQRIKFVREYVEKHAGSILSTKEVVDDLCDEAEKLWNENRALREQLFQIEQEQDPERRWENILAAKLDRAIRENINKDYLELSNSINNDIFIITIQRKFGQTPEQLRRSSDIRRLKAAKKIVNLLNDNRQMQKKLNQLDKELRALKIVEDATWDNIKTREDLELVIDAVNNFIKQHNTAIWRKQIGKMSGSIRESLHESWTRVADNQHKVNEIKKELEAIKIQLNRKNVDKSKFSKYRKRGRK